MANFHTPKSTLLMMVSAFADPDFIKEAYEIAVKEKYYHSLWRGYADHIN